MSKERIKMWITVLAIGAVVNAVLFFYDFSILAGVACLFSLIMLIVYLNEYSKAIQNKE